MLIPYRLRFITDAVDKYVVLLEAACQVFHLPRRVLRPQPVESTTTSSKTAREGQALGDSTKLAAICQRSCQTLLIADRRRRRHHR